MSIELCNGPTPEQLITKAIGLLHSEAEYDNLRARCSIDGGEDPENELSDACAYTRLAALHNEAAITLSNFLSSYRRELVKALDPYLSSLSDEKIEKVIANQEKRDTEIRRLALQ